MVDLWFRPQLWTFVLNFKTASNENGLSKYFPWYKLLRYSKCIFIWIYSFTLYMFTMIMVFYALFYLSTIILRLSICECCIRRIRKFLTDSACRILVQATIQSRLNYCNILLYGINDHNINILQTLQNSAARLILNLPYYAQATHPRRQLHWLPVRQRIIFKILTFIFKCIHSEAPVYLCELIQSYNPSRLLRSSSGNSLVVPRTSSEIGRQRFLSV